MDDAKSRRNNISYNEKFGVKPAILAGDWLLSKVLSILNEIEELEIYKMFSNAIQNMTEGELVQYYGKYTVPTLEEYFEKNYKKTGQLYTIASVAPLILSKEYGHIDSLKQFAKYFSNAFQIADDLSDYFVKTEDKTGCSDVEQGIYTLPEIIKINYNDKDLYEECCKILKHQVNLSLECLSFIEENEYKEAIILLCKSLLLKDKNIEV